MPVESSAGVNRCKHPVPVADSWWFDVPPSAFRSSSVMKRARKLDWPLLAMVAPG